jgi:hypothetical protein
MMMNEKKEIFLCCASSHGRCRLSFLALFYKDDIQAI